MTLHRRHVLALLASACGGALASPAFAQAPAMSRPTAFAFSFSTLDGKSLRLAEHAGKPILIVNTASQCGYTPQYAGLQELWTRYRDKGLLIIGVPSNDFGGQEPGGPDEINKTAHGQYGVGFPLAAKAEVRGTVRAPVLQMGGAGAAGRRPAMELPQVPGRPRRANHRGVFDADRADRSARHRGHRERAEIAERSPAAIRQRQSVQ